MPVSDAETVRRGRAGLVVIGVVVAVMLIVGGVAVFAFNNLSSETRDHRVTDHVERLEVTNGSGDVSITATDDDEISVRERLRWTGDKPEPKIDVDGDTLRLSAHDCRNFGPFGRCDVDYEIALPADTEVYIESGSGHVSVSGVSATHDIAISSGDIHISDPTGDLTLHASSGDMTVENMAVGSLTAEVSSGDMTLSGAATNAELSASSGEIGARGLTVERLEAEVSSGDLDLLFDAAFAAVDIVAGSGSVNLLVPDDGTVYAVDLTVGSGDTNVSVAEGGQDHKVTVDIGSGDLEFHYG